MANLALKLMSWKVLMVMGLYFGSSQALSYSDNRYELTIAISEEVNKIATNDRASFLESLRATLTKSSSSLFEATENYFYFAKINILIPPSWASIVSGATPTISHTYLNADVRVEETMDENEMPMEEVLTKNSKICGQPGEFILVPPSFFVSPDAVAKYGDKAKVLVREFARYRYGVHDEHGFPGDAQFPYSFMNTQGHWQVNGCNNSNIAGSLADQMGNSCSLETADSSDCRLRPDLTSTNGPTSSLMFMQFLPTVTKFCDSTNHDRTAPNKQNYWCRNRSVRTIIRQSPEFSNVNALPSNTNVVPQFNYLFRAAQTIYIVLDTSSHTLTDNTVFNYVKEQITQSLIPQLVSTSGRSFVGIATMGGQVINSTNNRLGGYLTEVQFPIQIGIQANSQLLISKINGLTRSSGQGLLLEKAVLDISDILTDFTHVSGSIALLIKLSDVTETATMNVESEATHLLNSRNIRLVSFEYGNNTRNKILDRTTSLSGGYHFAANVQDYRVVFPNVVSKLITELLPQSLFRSRRVQLFRGPFISNAMTPFTSFYTIDFKDSIAEISFFIPAERANDYEIEVKGTNGQTYSLNSSEHSQQFLSWDGKFKVHTFLLTVVSVSNANFKVSTSAGPISGYVEAIEILNDNVPLYVGGGGPPLKKPIEVEVYTSGNNGVLNMAAVTEDTSFLIFASVRRGSTIAPFLSSAVATVHGPAGKTELVSLRDNGLYPDALMGDGIYSGFYKPPITSAEFRISIRLDGYRRPVANTLNEKKDERSLPIDQNESICCGSTSTLSVSSTSFQRLLPYVTRLRTISPNFYEERPLRIMDFKIDRFDNNSDTIMFSWTSPQETYGNNRSVDSYRLVYSNNLTGIINERGEIVGNALSVALPDVIEGSLIPSVPYSRQSVTIILNRTSLTGNVVYFTIGSRRISDMNRPIDSYPSPMVYLTMSPYTVTTTTGITSTMLASSTLTNTETTRSSSTQTSTSITTVTSMRSTSAVPNTGTSSPASTTNTMSSSIPTTKEPNSAQRVLVSPVFSHFLLVVVLCCAIFLS